MPDHLTSNELRMDAYYYSFGSAGVPEIDLILSAVACAGKAYHHTECWQDECEWEPHEGKSPVDWIYNAAVRAAEEIKKLRHELEIAKLGRAAAAHALAEEWQKQPPTDEPGEAQSLRDGALERFRSRVVADLLRTRIPRRAAEPPSAWRPIETAPTLGKWVLLWWPDVTDAAFVGYCVDGQWRAATSGDRWPTLPGPTHWMPLPEGPSVTKSEIPAAAQSAANSGQCESRKAAQSGTAAGASDETKGGQS